MTTRPILYCDTLPTNARAWAICRPIRNKQVRAKRYHVRRIVWGRLLARAEKRDDEVIRPALIVFRERLR